MSGMIRVSRDFPKHDLITKASSRRGIRSTTLASLSEVADDPLPRRGDSPPKKTRKKRAA